MYVFTQVSLLIVLFFIAACSGLKFIRIVGYTRDDALGLFVVSTACGFVLLTLGLLLLGMLGLFIPFLIFFLPVLLFLLSIREASFFIRALRSGIGECTWSFKAKAIPLVCFGVFIVVNILKSLLPPHGPTDVLYYHMTLPKLFLAHGSLVTYPTFLPSFFPSNGELLFSLFSVLGRPVFAGLAHFGFTLLTALGLYAFAKKHIGQELALLPSIVFLTAPVVNSWGTMAYTSNILGCYIFLLCMLLLEYDHQAKARETLIWGLLIGMAVGTKYQAIPVLAVIFLFFALLSIRIGQRFLLLLSGAFVVGVAIASPWFIRNLVVTGNPFFPILQDIFASSLIPRVGDWKTDTALSGGLASALTAIKADPLAFLSFLYSNAWMHGDYQRFIGPLFLGLIPFAPFTRKTPVKWPLLLLVLSLCLVSTYVLRGNIRYAVVLVVFMSLLSGTVAQEVWIFARKGERYLMVCVLSVIIMLYSLQNYHAMLSHGRLSAACNPRYAVSFLRTFERSFRPAELANQSIPAGATVLFHGLVRYYYFNFEPLNDHRRQALITYEEATTGDDIYQIMQRHGITYLIQDDLLHEKTRALNIFYQDDARFVDFCSRYLELVCRENGISAYRIRDSQ